MLATLLAFALAPSRATDSHKYGATEYAVIHDGLAPNKTRSLAAHGEGDDGSDNFHIWLMAEPAHRKIVSLGGIGSDNILDSGPDAFSAFWATDSNHVAVTFRSDRHIAELELYSVDGKSAHAVAGPTLFNGATGRDIGDKDDLRSSVSTIAWSSPTRFVLTEHRLFQTTDAGFAGTLGQYGKLDEKLNGGALSVEFSAEADCELVAGNKYRIVNLRAGKFGAFDE
jgi:hypothetical protein